MPSPIISVVIPVHNAASIITNTLEALEMSSLQPTQVICVDDASTDQTVSVIQGYHKSSALNLHLAKLESQRGAAAARNFGTKLADGEYILFIDADVVVEPDTLRTMLHCIENHPYLAVVAMFRDFSQQPGLLAHFQAYLVNAVYAQLNPHDSPCLGTQCVLIKTETFRATAGFSEDYQHATVEDFAFGYLLQKQGGRICIATEAGIVHNHPYSILSFVRNYYFKARDLARLLLDNPHVGLEDAGYYDWRNTLTILITGLTFTLLLLCAILKMPNLLLLCLGLFAILLLWAPFFARATRRLGAHKAIIFTALRIVVALIGGLGCLDAMISLLLEKRLAFIDWYRLLRDRIRETLSLTE